MVKAKRFKKGSPEAKAFMAKLRKMKGKKTTSKKVGSTKIPKKIKTHGKTHYNLLHPDIIKKPFTKEEIEDILTGKKKLSKRIGATKKSIPKKRVSSMHKDTKSHNVNIRVVSGVRKSGYVGRLIIKKYTLSELKKMNPIYFEKGNDKFFGVYKRKLMISTKLDSQVMIEAHLNTFGTQKIRQYTIRKISSSGEISSPIKFDSLLSASAYIGKNIIL